MSTREKVSWLVILLGWGWLNGAEITPHAGRRESSTPGLVLETGARTAACDALFFSGGGEHLLAAGDDKLVRSWRVTDGGRLVPDTLPTIRWPLFREIRGNIYAATLSPDQRRVAFGGNGRTSGGFAVAVADRLTGQLLHGSDTPPGATEQGAIWAIAFSPSGNRVGIGTDRGSVWIWELSTNRFTLVGKHPDEPRANGWANTIRLVAFTSERELISVCGNGEMVKWSDTAPLQKNLIHTFGGPISTPVVLSPDRRWIGAVLEASQGEREIGVELVSFPDTQRKRRIIYRAADTEHYSIPHRLAFNKDSTQLAVGVRIVGNRRVDPSIKLFQERGGRVDLYDLTQADPPAQPGPTQSLYAESLSFHPKNANWLAIAGGDNHEVTLWDLRTNEKLGEVAQPGRCIWSVAITADGQKIAYQTEREPDAKHPNQRGRGSWRGFDLVEAKFTPAVSPELSTTRESDTGWKVLTANPQTGELWQFWKLQSPNNGQIFTFPWSRAEDEFPRCYSFLPPDENSKTPERLLVGHYWGASLFELTPDGPRRVRLFRGHEGYVSALAVSADGKRLVTGSRDMTIAGWTLADWPHHPRLGAELFVRDERLFVGELAAGSPIWELGLEPGDEILSLRVPDPDQPGKAKIIYDRTEAAPTGNVTELLNFFKTGLRPGQEHVFYWKRPNAPTIFGAITTLLERPLWRFFPHAEQEWIIWQWRDYRYAASALGDNSVGWQTSFPLKTLQTPRFATAAQLRSEFYQPQVVQDTLKTWQTQQALVRFNQLQPPTVTVKDPRSVPDGYEVVIEATPQGSLETQQPGRLLVWVNDYLAVDERPLTQPGETFRRTVVIPTSKFRAGTNLISSQCYARSGARGDARPKLLTHQPATRNPRTLFGLIVGVGDYKRSRPQQLGLNAAEDAQVLARALQRQKNKPPFDQVRVKLLQNGEVTRTAVEQALTELASQAKPDDMLVLYLGGHGTSRRQLLKQNLPASLLQGVGRYLFLCGDADVRRLPDTTISFEDLQQRITKLSCHKLVLLDTCHSGEAEVSGGNSEANPIRMLTEHGVGPVILAASAYDQQAIENKALDPLGGACGLFTIALRKILEERPIFLAADQDKNDLLTSEELGRAVIANVKRLLDEHNGIFKLLGQPATDVQTPVQFIPALEAPVPVFGK